MPEFKLFQSSVLSMVLGLVSKSTLPFPFPSHFLKLNCYMYSQTKLIQISQSAFQLNCYNLVWWKPHRWFIFPSFMERILNYCWVLISYCDSCWKLLSRVSCERGRQMASLCALWSACSYVLTESHFKCLCFFDDYILSIM